MKVVLVTKTNEEPLSIEVRCNETWTALTHIETGIATLQHARAWFVKQQPKEEKKK